jgi:hypothetical protein
MGERLSRLVRFHPYLYGGTIAEAGAVRVRLGWRHGVEARPGGQTRPPPSLDEFLERHDGKTH